MSAILQALEDHDNSRLAEIRDLREALELTDEQLGIATNQLVKGAILMEKYTLLVTLMSTYIDIETLKKLSAQAGF